MSTAYVISAAFMCLITSVGCQNSYTVSQVACSSLEQPYNYTTQTGVILSPNYPQTYYSNSNCLWLITAPLDQGVNIRFTDFATEQGYDFVSVYDGSSVLATRIARLSGIKNDSDVLVYTTTQRCMLLTFVTDSSFVNRGFNATFWIYPRTVTSDTVRLVNGSSNSEGRLEILHNGIWGTVCDDDFDDADARVACYSLGYGYIGRFMSHLYGQGIGTIWLDDLICTGYETSLGNCRSNGWGINNCGHSEDVSISCSLFTTTAPPLPPAYPSTTTTFQNPVFWRLSDGPSYSEGRLEVFYYGSWGTVCSDNFDDNAARVACYSLGYGYVGRFLNNQYGPGVGPIWLDNLGCTGYETSLENCRRSSWGLHNCFHSSDVSISCNLLNRTASSTYPTTTTRTTTTFQYPVLWSLADGPSNTEGRLHVFYNGLWGTVCDDNFDDNAARVVCYSLGYGYVGRFLNNQYGQGVGPIWIDNAVCTGYETSLVNCRRNGWGINDCGHSEDVSISCNPSTTTAATTTPTIPVLWRLVDGPSDQEGRLEVLHNGVWGSVCDDGFDDTDARVACYSLGYGYVGRFLKNRYGPGVGTIWLGSLGCTGYETSLGYCPSSGWGVNYCGHSEDVSISCGPATTTTISYDTVTWRLVDGPSDQEGRLEVLYDGVWGTVCDDGFDDTDAHVACYSLGYGYFGRFLYNYYGPGVGTIWLDDITCTGYETSLENCRRSGWGSNNCGHSEDVSISCSATAMNGRLYIPPWISGAIAAGMAVLCVSTILIVLRCKKISCRDACKGKQQRMSPMNREEIEISYISA